MRTMHVWKRVPMLVLACAAVSAPAQQTTVVFTAGFETTDTPSYQEGEQLHHAGGTPYRWNWSGADIGVITAQAEAVFSGGQGLSAVRSTTADSQRWWTRGTNAFAPLTSDVARVSFAVKATNWAVAADSLLEFWVLTEDADAADSGTNKAMRSAYLVLQGDGRLRAYTNNSVAITVASGVAVTDWNELRVELALTSRTYHVFLNGAQVATNFSFYGVSARGAAHSLQFKEYNNGSSSGGVYLDAVDVAGVAAGPDADGDGLPDAWELEHFGTTTNGAAADHDLDGWSAFEEYVADTQPTNDLSRLGPVSVSGGVAAVTHVLVSATSTGRLYGVSACSALAAAPQVWQEAGVQASGNGGSLVLDATNAPAGQAYRVYVRLP